MARAMGSAAAAFSACVGAVVLLAAIAAWGAVVPSAEGANGPNVLVIETDDQTVGQMRVMDNVNSLIGDQGVTFANSFVNFSLCCPSRSTFLTGQYAHNHGVLGNQAPNGGFNRFETLHGSNNLAVWMQDAGYYTGMIGKYLNEYSNDPPIPPGWSEWDAVAPASQDVYDYTLNENGTLVDYDADPSSFKQDVLTGKAVDFVNRIAPMGQPFFLWLTYTAPHVGGPEPNPNPPFDCAYTAKPPPRYADTFASEPLPQPPNFNEADVSDKPAAIRNLPSLSSDQIADIRRKYRCQLESLLSVDDGVKQVVDALSQDGALDNTLIIFTSDNGYFHGEHRIPSEKQRIYDESIRVPLEMRGPGIPAGETVDDLAINADLAPTIVGATGVDPGLVMDGRSLIPVAQQPGIERGRELLVEQPGRFKAIRTERYMYAEHATGERELYDVQSDPFELVSLQNDPAYQAVKAQLAKQLGALKTCAGPSCLLHSPPSSTQRLDFSPSDLPTTTFKSGKAILHTQTSYVNPGNGNPGGATSRARLYFDDDFKFNPSATPTCHPTSFQPDETMADAMSHCGPARIGDGTAQINVNGASANGCALPFNGRSGADPTVVLFMRFKVANPSTIKCTSPASNHRGDTSVVLAAPLKNNNSYGGADLVGGKLLDINNITTASAYPLSDLNISIQKGSYVQARCHDDNQRLDLEARFTDNQNTTQTIHARKTCT